MAEIKKYLDTVALGALVDQIKSKDADTLAAAKTYAEGLGTNYDVAGAAAGVQAKLDAEIARADAAEKANADAIAVEKGRVDGIVADYLKAADKTELKNGIDGVRTDLGNKDDAANSEGSAFARIANLKQVVSDLTGGSGESVESQINQKITAYDTATVQPIAGRVSANETKLAGISEGANKTTMVVEGETLKVTIA